MLTIKTIIFAYNFRCPISITTSSCILSFSKTTSNIWNKICDLKLVYLVIFTTWIFPILINLHKQFEPGIEFSPGNGNETGHVCYAKENGTYVGLTTWQWRSSVVNNILLFIVIITSYLIAWCGIKKENEKNREKIVALKSAGNRQIRLFGYNVHAQKLQKDIRLTGSIICLTYVVSRLPLIILGYYKVSNVTLAIWILYIFQYCMHFITYAIIQKKYRKAYCDVLRIVFPCMSKCKINEENLENDVGTITPQRKRKALDMKHFNV